MGKLAPTIHERFEQLRAEQAKRKPDITFEQIRQQAEDRKRRTAEFDAKHVLPKGSRPVCIYCYKELRLFRWRAYDNHAGKQRVYGDYGDNLFCGLRCAHAYAVKDAGNRFGKERGIRGS